MTQPFRQAPPLPSLPAPPLRVHSTVFTRAAFLLFLWAAMSALMGWYGVTQLPHEVTQLRHEQAVWESGAPAVDGSYEGEVSTSRAIFSTFKLDVTYEDMQGVEHKGKLEFSSLGGSIDDKTPGEIRYDPDHPDQFALSKAVEMSGSRWASVAFFGLACVGIIALFTMLAVRTVTDARRTMACARDGQTVALEIVSASNADRHGTVRYTFRVVGGASAPKLHKGVLQKRALLRSGANGVGVQSRTEPDAVVLLASDGYPFDLPGDARDALTRGG